MVQSGQIKTGFEDIYKNDAELTLVNELPITENAGNDRRRCSVVLD